MVMKLTLIKYTVLEMVSNRTDNEIHVSHTPSTIDQNQDLEVRLPNLGASDVMVPGTLKLYFTLELTSSDIAGDIL